MTQHEAMKFIIEMESDLGTYPTNPIDDLETAKALLGDCLLTAANLKRIALKTEEGEIMREVKISTDMDLFLQLHGS